MKYFTFFVIALFIVCAAGCSKSDSPTSPDTGQSLMLRIYVNPASGADSNPGSDTAPLKTIKKALATAQSGQRVALQAGTYDITSGQTFPDTIPNGVTVEAVSAGLAVLLGTAGQTAFTGSGNDTLRYLTVQGFNILMNASTGIHVMYSTNVTNVQTCFNLTGSTQGIANACTFKTSGVASLTDIAQVTLNTSTTSGGGGDALVTLQKASIFNMNNSTMSDAQLTGIAMYEASQATLYGCSIANVSLHGAGGSSSIDMSGTAHLSLRSTYISGAYSYDVLSRNAGTITTVRASTFSGTAIRMDGGSFDADSSNFAYGTVAFLITGSSTSYLTLRNSSVQYYTSSGIMGGSGSFSISARNSTFTNCQYGIYVYGTNGYLDLGTAASPGGNTITGNSQYGVRVGFSGGITASAVGNTWIPNIEGANSAGKYSAQLLIGPTPNATPLNYYIDSNGGKIQF
jgi:hypothetical protein